MSTASRNFCSVARSLHETCHIVDVAARTDERFGVDGSMRAQRVSDAASSSSSSSSSSTSNVVVRLLRTAHVRTSHWETDRSRTRTDGRTDGSSNERRRSGRSLIDRRAASAGANVRNATRETIVTAVNVWLCAGITLKCLPHEKSARREIITELIYFSLSKYRRPHKSLPIIESPPRKVFPGRQWHFTCKNSTRPGGCRAGRIFADKLSAAWDFSGGDSIMGTSVGRRCCWFVVVRLRLAAQHSRCMSTLIIEPACSVHLATMFASCPAAICRSLLATVWIALTLSAVCLTDDRRNKHARCMYIAYGHIRLLSTIGIIVHIYTVSQKNIPDIFDRNLKINYQILIIFVTNIPNTTCHQISIQFPNSPNVMFLHYLGKAD